MFTEVLAIILSIKNKILTFINVPTTDMVDNINLTNVIGNKNDTVVTYAGTNKSLIGYIKGIVNNTNTPSINDTTNILLSSSIGNKLDNKVIVVGTNSSLISYIKGMAGSGSVVVPNGSSNAKINDIIGNKDDTEIYETNNVSSLNSYIKGLNDDISKKSVPHIVSSISTNTSWSDVLNITANGKLCGITQWITPPPSGTSSGNLYVYINGTGIFAGINVDGRSGSNSAITYSNAMVFNSNFSSLQIRHATSGVGHYPVNTVITYTTET
jgi:hypothetical protein